ncbi:MAG TPA: acyl-CoA dehydrogenase family protein [Ramlibacter sp.]|nr:acyl-CoA dehydrogenase family protein [Ramlibacter sp.]
MSDSMDAIRDICASIVKRVDRAYVAECGRKGEVPQKLWQQWAETGLLGLGIPEEYGGSGGGTTEVCLATDLLHQAGLEMPHGTPNHMSRTTIAKHGTPAQKEKYLPRTVTGEQCFAFAITEADAGTNTFKIRTSAKRQADGNFLLNGQKHYITNFSGADNALVVARTEPPSQQDRTAGLSLLIVDTRSKGISCTPMDIGAHLPDRQYVVNFDDVIVPAENVVGEPGKGLQALFDSVNPERLVTSAKSLGLADHVLGRAVEYAKMRAPFGTPIGAYQSIQHPMALAKCRIEAARALLYVAARKFDAGENAGLEANMVKFLASDAFKSAADIAMTTFGGAGMDMGQDILPFYVRAKLAEVAPLTNNVVLGFVAQQGLNLPKSY